MRAASNQADRLKGGEYSRETRYLGSNQERRNSTKNGEDDDYKKPSRVDPLRHPSRAHSSPSLEALGGVKLPVSLIVGWVESGRINRPGRA